MVPSQRTYAVELVIDDETQRVLVEKWHDEQGRLDRPGDLPAVTTYRADTGVPDSWQWYQQGLLHRDGDNPASIAWGVTSEAVVEELYAIRGSLHREGDKPAQIVRYENGATALHYHYHHGLLHRDQGPARESWSPDGDLEPNEREFWRHGEQIRAQPLSSVQPMP